MRSFVEYYFAHENDEKYCFEGGTQSGFEIECRKRNLDPYTPIPVSPPIYWQPGGEYFKASKEDTDALLVIKTARELYAKRSALFSAEKKKYKLSNKSLYGLTGVPSKRWDEFGSRVNDMNMNVFYAYCFFFEYKWEDAERFIYYSTNAFDNESVTDKLFRMYIDHQTYALSTFVYDVNKIYEIRRKEGKEQKMPSFYDLNTKTYKYYFDTSLSDCKAANGYRFEEIIEENHKERDRRRKEYKGTW